MEKLQWDLTTNKNKSWVKNFLNKYKTYAPPKIAFYSFYFRSIFKDKQIFKNSSLHIIMNKKDTNLWLHNWINNKSLYSQLIWPFPLNEENIIVSSIISSNSNLTWNLNALLFNFPLLLSDMIKCLALPPALPKQKWQNLLESNSKWLLLKISLLLSPKIQKRQK